MQRKSVREWDNSPKGGGQYGKAAAEEITKRVPDKRDRRN